MCFPTLVFQGGPKIFKYHLKQFGNDIISHILDTKNDINKNFQCSLKKSLLILKVSAPSINSTTFNLTKAESVILQTIFSKHIHLKLICPMMLTFLIKDQT